MEEIDNIIISSLKNINCSLEDDASSLKAFDTETFYKSVICCIEVITPGQGFPKSLPQSMSQRLKVSSSVAEHLIELGFRGDIGYQNILYSNEVEMRKLLMFLIEKLPRESEKSTLHIDDNAVLMQRIKTVLGKNLQSPWVPSCVLSLPKVAHAIDEWRKDFSTSVPFESTTLQVPRTQQEASEALKEYWTHSLPLITNQCPRRMLIPSLINEDSCDWSQFSHSLANNVGEPIILPEEAVRTAEEIPLTIKPAEESPETLKAPLDQLKEDLALKQTALKEKKSSVGKLDAKVRQLDKVLSSERTAVELMLDQLRIKSKTELILSDEANFEKLQNLVDSSSKKLVDLANQWREVQTPLLNEYFSLQQEIYSKESESRSVENKLKKSVVKSRELAEEIEAKQSLESTLSEECKKLKKNTNRSAYTRRILEIIGNIKKQKEEIRKVLDDTKVIQKELNNLQEKIERSFTSAEEMIFRNAKQDEMSRGAYKLLANLHQECGEVIQSASELGVIVREARNLQEQLEAEEQRGTTAKLERVLADLAEIRKETSALMMMNKKSGATQ